MSLKYIQLIKRNSSHWEIVLNRPEKYNAINSDMYQCLTDLLDQAANDSDLVLLTITGNGKFYSAGTDLSEPMKSFVNILLIFINNLCFLIRHRRISMWKNRLIKQCFDYRNSLNNLSNFQRF